MSALHGPGRLTPLELEELRHAWRRYCEVIAQLDATAADLEAFMAKLQAGRRERAGVELHSADTLPPALAACEKPL
jgi:hypothetical protein